MTDQTFWVPKAETENYGTIYMYEFLSQNKSTAAFKVLKDARDREGYEGIDANKRLEELGWELVEVKLKEVDNSKLLPTSNG